MTQLNLLKLPRSLSLSKIPVNKNRVKGRGEPYKLFLFCSICSQ